MAFTENPKPACQKRCLIPVQKWKNIEKLQATKIEIPKKLLKKVHTQLSIGLLGEKVTHTIHQTNASNPRKLNTPEIR
jgi:hypothetical protein